MNWLRRFLIFLGSFLGLWLVLELVVRRIYEGPLETDFYGSISRDQIPGLQAHHSVKVSVGPGWIHLSWIADPEAETYRVEHQIDQSWQPSGQAQFGSFLVRDRSGRFRVWAEPKDGGQDRLIGEVDAAPLPGESPLHMPQIAGAWQPLFEPQDPKSYINDHTVFQDAEGNWRLVGITGKADENLETEAFFAVGVSETLPPEGSMQEDGILADFDELAWAPHVIREAETYHMFWSPHRLHHMTSRDGVRWDQHQVIMDAPYHIAFRDPMVLKVEDGQWVLYTTARSRYYSQVDLYQSFDLIGWQYIGSALRTGWGSERNALFASTESPFVTNYEGRYYLSLTYNNDSFFWTAVLLRFKIWLNRPSYNETLVFQADNPYDFGVYRGQKNAPTLLTRLEAHAPEIIYHPEQDSWYVTTAGWPWVATLTSGEVAVAPLRWEPVH